MICIITGIIWEVLFLVKISDNSLYSNSNNHWYNIESFSVGSFNELLLTQSDSITILYVDSGNIDVEFTTSAEEKISIMLRKFDFLLIDFDVKIKSYKILKEPTSLSRITIKKTYNESFNMAKHISINSNFVKVLIAKQPVIQIKRTNSFNKIIKLIENETTFKSKDETNEYMKNLLISMLFIEIARDIIYSTQSIGSVYVKKTCDYIHSNYEDDIKLDDVANLLFVHPSYLRKLFKEELNETFVGYLTNIRIERAKQLLSNSSLPMVEISEAIGIKNREHFQRIFTKSVGITPGSYRKLKTLEKDIQTTKGTHKKSLSI